PIERSHPTPTRSRPCQDFFIIWIAIGRSSNSCATRGILHLEKPVLEFHSASCFSSRLHSCVSSIDLIVADLARSIALKVFIRISASWQLRTYCLSRNSLCLWYTSCIGQFLL